MGARSRLPLGGKELSSCGPQEEPLYLGEGLPPTAALECRRGSH